MDLTDPMNSLFYSLPPAGNKIPFSLLLRAMMSGNRNGGLKKSESLKKVIGDAHILYLSSGRAALWLILRVLAKLRPGKRKIIIPAYTCPAVASAVLKAGFQPVLCDINLDDYGYSLRDLDRLIEADVLAVVVVHLFGFPANINQIMPICRKFDAFIVEDAAQAFGNEVPSTGTKLGLIGDAGFFSFGRGKPLSAIHGGLVVTESETIYEALFDICKDLNEPSVPATLKYMAQLACYDILSSPYLYWMPQKIPSLHLGETIFEPNFHLSKGLRSSGSIIEGLLRSLENDKRSRMTKSEWYCNNLPDTPIIKKPPSRMYPYHRYPLLIGDRAVRDAIIRELTSMGVSGAIFYPCPLNQLPGLCDVLQDSRTYTNAKVLSDALITLPVHGGVSSRDMSNIKSIIENAVKL